MRHQSKKRKIFKLNEDDILDIVTEYLAGEYSYDTYQSMALITGDPGENLRVVAVIGDFDDEEMNQLDLEKLDQKIDYNGTITHIEEHHYVNQGVTEG